MLIEYLLWADFITGEAPGLLHLLLKYRISAVVVTANNLLVVG